MEKDYIVDLSSIEKGRRNGVSGMMRVKNDAEFLEDSVLSCLDALDELVIVYNDCEDDSPSIIKRLQESYPDKIKAYEYKPTVHSFNLDEATFERILHSKVDQVDSLANYNNFALSKTTCKYVLKIDADQIYLPEILNEWCDVYRKSKAPFPTPYNIWAYIKISLYFKNKDISFKRFSDNQYAGYLKTVKFLAAKFNIMVSLSGFNVFYDGQMPFLPCGYKKDGVMILPPFNGVGDTLMFKVTSETRFVPYFNQEYCEMTGSKRTVIEKFVGARRPSAVGFVWCHLNMNRSKIVPVNKKLLKNHSDKFIDLSDGVEFDVDGVLSQTHQDLLSDRCKKQFRFFYSFQKERLSRLLENMKLTKYLKNKF